MAALSPGLLIASAWSLSQLAWRSKTHAVRHESLQPRPTAVRIVGPPSKLLEIFAERLPGSVLACDAAFAFPATPEGLLLEISSSRDPNSTLPHLNSAVLAAHTPPESVRERWLTTAFASPKPKAVGQRS